MHVCFKKTTSCEGRHCLTIILHVGISYSSARNMSENNASEPLFSAMTVAGAILFAEGWNITHQKWNKERERKRKLEGGEVAIVETARIVLTRLLVAPCGCAGKDFFFSRFSCCLAVSGCGYFSNCLRWSGAIHKGWRRGFEAACDGNRKKK